MSMAKCTFCSDVIVYVQEATVHTLGALVTAAFTFL